MTVITPDLAATSSARAVVPCLTVGPAAGRVISILFVATILLFLLGVFALAV